MSWVRRHEEIEQHSCITPGQSGTLGDLWRCDDCQQLWRLGDACNWCDRNGRHQPILVNRRDALVLVAEGLVEGRDFEVYPEPKP